MTTSFNAVKDGSPQGPPPYPETLTLPADAINGQEEEDRAPDWLDGLIAWFIAERGNTASKLRAMIKRRQRELRALQAALSAAPIEVASTGRSIPCRGEKDFPPDVLDHAFPHRRPSATQLALAAVILRDGPRSVAQLAEATNLDGAVVRLCLATDWFERKLGGYHLTHVARIALGKE